MKTGKFKIETTKNTIYIVDVETNKKINLNKKEDVTKLTKLLNEYYLIIKNKWRI